MGKFTSVFGLIFLCSCIVAVPAATIQLWDLVFLPAPNPHTLGNFLQLGTWVATGTLACVWLARHRDARIESRVASAAPKGYAPKLLIKGLHGDEYIGFDPATRKIVFVDIGRNLAACQNFDFVQGWTIETEGSRAKIIFRFNCLEISSLQIPIVSSCKNDLAARLNFLL